MDTSHGAWAEGETLTNTRQRFQEGSLRKVERSDGWAWEYRYRDHSQPGSPQRQRTLSSAQYPTESKARAAVQAHLLALNGSEKYLQKQQATMATLIELYIESERLLQVKALRPGDAPVEGAVQYATACSYLTSLNRYIKPRWGHLPITEVKAAAVDQWLKGLRRLSKPSDPPGYQMPLLSPKTRGNIKPMLYRLLEKAMFWELISLARNPIGLVEVKGVSKRVKKPFILTVDQFHAVLSQLPEPYRQMVQVAMCLGLRVSEVLALKWSDFDFQNQTLLVIRAAVHGRVGPVKTDYSQDELPMDPVFAALMVDWRSRCPKSEGNWVFPNPDTLQIYHASPIGQDYIRAAGREVGLPKDIGWHTLRHTYRSYLDETGAPMGVQQKLMRHAQISTTMNIYGNAQMHSKREANSKVIQMLLPSHGEMQVAV